MLPIFQSQSDHPGSETEIPLTGLTGRRMSLVNVFPKSHGEAFHGKLLDVALKANVSIATVSRVVNKSDHKVNPATREKVLGGHQRAGLPPQCPCQGAPHEKDHDHRDHHPRYLQPLLREIVRGIQDTADLAGYAVMLHQYGREAERIIRYIYLLREKSADGVIFCGGIINGMKHSPS